MKKLLVLFAFLFSLGTFAKVDAPLEHLEKIEIVKPDVTQNFVNLSMERQVETFSEHQLNEKFYFDEASPLDVDALKKLRPTSKHLKSLASSLDGNTWLKDFNNKQDSFINALAKLQQEKKNSLIANKIKEHIPDFTINDAEKYKNQLFSVSQNNETTYLLRHNNKEIRLITFGIKQNPLDYKANSVSISIEEYYY